MQLANIHHAKSQLSQLINRALAGEEVIIARAGEPLVRLAPVHQDTRPRQGGQLKGQIWILEIAIKQATGKLKVPATLLEIIAACQFTELPLSMAHAAEVQVLPTIHKDPFDRTLVAQARVESLTLVNRDQQLRRYDLPLLAA